MNELPHRHRPWLLATMGMSGAAVMVCEVLGARMLSPFFGVGLFSWSALISVTLTALAVGYFVGGSLAIRIEGPRPFYGLALLAGLLIAVIPRALDPVLALAEDLDLRWGALLSALLLFGPTLVVLGMLSPLAVEFLARDGSAAGKESGRVFAISTACGLVATLLTGFVLIPSFSISAIMTGTSALLLGTGAIGMVLHRKAYAAAALMLVPWLIRAKPPSDEPLENVRILERARSHYGELAVVEDTRRDTATLRLLRSDQSFVGAQWVEPGQPAFGFVHVLEAVRLANPTGRDLLLIGLGVGSLSNELADDGIRTDVVEIDPGIVHFAQKYFGYESTGAIHVEDARTFVRRSHAQYDFVVHDTFTGGAMPEHLLSAEFLEEVRRTLRPKGVLALNLVGSVHGPAAEHAAAVFATLDHVFGNVRTFRDSAETDDAHGLSNLLFFAADEPVTFTSPERIAFNSPACEQLLTSFQAWEVTASLRGKGVVVTDSHNPLGRLALPAGRAFRHSMRALYPREFWMQ